jgi:ferritin-like metal-binding protein YciE
MENKQLKELLLQSLEHEMGGVHIYEAAVSAVRNEGLKTEFGKYLEQTRKHVQILETVFATMKIDPREHSPGRQIIAMLGKSLVTAIKEAMATNDATASELVACECVVLAETKDHLNWELIGECARHLAGEEKKVLQAAYDEIEDQEDEHLYHSKGWCRELWIQSLGMKAVLPPPEERRHVKTAIGAARAEQSARH